MSHGRPRTQTLKKRAATNDTNHRQSQGESREPPIKITPRKSSKIPVNTQGSVCDSVTTNEHRRGVRKRDAVDWNGVGKHHSVNGSNTWLANSDTHWQRDRNPNSSKETRTQRATKTRHRISSFNTDDFPIKDFKVPLKSYGESHGATNNREEETDSESFRQTDAKSTTVNDLSGDQGTVVVITSRQTTRIKILSPSAQRKVISEKLRLQSYRKSNKYSGSKGLEPLLDLRQENIDLTIVPGSSSNTKHREHLQPEPAEDIRHFTIQHTELDGTSMRHLSDLEHRRSRKATAMERHNSPVRTTGSRQSTQVSQTSARHGKEVKQVTPRHDVSQNTSSPRQHTKLVHQKSREKSEMKKSGWQRSTRTDQMISQNADRSESSPHPDQDALQTNSRQDTKLSQTILTQNTDRTRRTPRQSGQATPRQHRKGLLRDDEITVSKRQPAADLKETKSRHNVELANIDSKSNTDRTSTISRQSNKSHINPSLKTPKPDTTHHGPTEIDLETHVSVGNARSRQRNLENTGRSSPNTQMNPDSFVKQEQAVPSNWSEDGVQDNGNTRVPNIGRNRENYETSPNLSSSVNDTRGPNTEITRKNSETSVRTPDRAQAVIDTRGPTTGRTRENSEKSVRSQDLSSSVNDTRGLENKRTRDNSVTSIRSRASPDRSGAVNNNRGPNIGRTRENSETSVQSQDRSGTVNKNRVPNVGRTRENSQASVRSQDRSGAINNTRVLNNERTRENSETSMRSPTVNNIRGPNIGRNRENSETSVRPQDRYGAVNNTREPNTEMTRKNFETSMHSPDRSGAVINTRGPHSGRTRDISETSIRSPDRSGAVNNTRGPNIGRTRENSDTSVHSQDRVGRSDDDDSWPEATQSSPNTSSSRQNTRIDPRHGTKSRSSETGETGERSHIKKSPSPKVAEPWSSPDVADTTLNESLSLSELRLSQTKPVEENQCNYCEMIFKSASQLDYHKSKLCFARSRASVLNDVRETRDFFTIGSVFHSSPRDWLVTGQASLRIAHNYTTEDQDAKVSNLHWDKCFNGRVTEFAVKVGYDFTAGCSVYVCRAKVNKEVVPGQVIPAYKCAHVACAGNEVKVKDYEVLTDPHELLSWKSTDTLGGIPRGAKKGGHDADDMAYFIARASAPDGSMCCGRYVPQDHKCYYAWKGQQLSTVKFEFLCKNAS